MSQMDMRLYNAAMEKLANLGGLQASYVADAAGADASERASQLAGDRAREDEESGLLDDLFGQGGDAARMINKRKRHANAAFAENDGARLLNVVDPSKLLTESPDQTLTGLAMLSGKKNKDRESRVLDQYKDIINKYQDPVKMDGEKTTRETPYHLMMQGQQADKDMDVAGHKQQRKEKPLNYWLNPLDRTGPLHELGDRLQRRIGASVAKPDSALGRFGMGAGNVGTLGLLGALAGGEDAQNKLRRSAVDNEIFDEHSMPEGANKSDKPKDGDGDGKVNDGTDEEKEARLKPGTEEFNNALHNHMYGKDMPKKKKKKKEKEVKKAALEIATKVAAYRRIQEKQARAVRIKLASHVLRMHHLRQELETYDPYQLSKSAAIGAHRADRMKAAALVRQIELEKQAVIGGILGGLARTALGGGKQALKSGIKTVAQGFRGAPQAANSLVRSAGNMAGKGIVGAAKGAAKGGAPGARGTMNSVKGIVNPVGRSRYSTMNPNQLASFSREMLPMHAKNMISGGLHGAVRGGARGVAQGLKTDPLAGTALLGGGAMAAGAGLSEALREPIQQGKQMLSQGQQMLSQGQQQAGQAIAEAPQAVGNYFGNLGNAFMGRGAAPATPMGMQQAAGGGTARAGGMGGGAAAAANKGLNKTLALTGN